MDENGKNTTNGNVQNTTDQKMMYPPGIMPNLMPGMMPGMVPGMMPGPGVMGYGPQQYTYVTDPMAELTQSSGAIIEQDIEMFEIFLPIFNKVCYIRIEWIRGIYEEKK